MSKLARIIAFASFALAACAASAQLIHEKPAGSEYYPEQGQDVVAGQQGSQGVVGQVGSVPRDTDDNYTSGPASSSSANSIVMSQATKEEKEQAKANGTAGGKGSAFLVFMIVGGVGLAATVVYLVVKK